MTTVCELLNDLALDLLVGLCYSQVSPLNSSEVRP